MNRMTAVAKPGQPMQTVALSAPPDGDDDVSFFKALEWRRTTRQIGAKPVSIPMLSDLLWTACGVNRDDEPFGLAGRTAASASNPQEIDIYVATQHVSIGTRHWRTPCSR